MPAKEAQLDITVIEAMVADYRQCLAPTAGDASRFSCAARYMKAKPDWSSSGERERLNRN